MPGALFDAFVTRLQRQPLNPLHGVAPRYLALPQGRVRLFDSGGQRPPLILVPDGPSVIESYARLIPILTDTYRVLCFDLPGFGYSQPALRYHHTLDEGAALIVAVMDAAHLNRATLALSCANGLYALRVAQQFPERVERLILTQTPCPDAMHTWADRTLPRVLDVPLLGQATFWATRKKAAAAWFRNAPAKQSDPAPFADPALHVLAHGGCFCMASTLQGLRRIPRQGFGQVNVPTTLVWGDRDRTHRQTDPNSILEVVPQAQVVRFADCGHMPDLEQPERFARVLLGG